MWQRAKSWAIRLWGWSLPVLRIFNPGPRARSAAWKGAFAGAVAVTTIVGVFRLRLGYGPAVDALAGFVIGAITVAGAGLALWLVVVIVARLPRPMTPLLAAALLVAVWLAGSRTSISFPLVGGLVVLAAILAAGLAGITERGWGAASKLRRAGVAALVLIGAGGLVGGLYWFVHPGSSDGLIEVVDEAFVPVPPLTAPDPAVQGPREVLTLTYGSGQDRRPEFGSEVDLIARRVDGSAFVNELTGFWAGFRHRYWGFEPDEFPLQGRVWYPAGQGGFPLVLIVHGNHAMRDYSDPGYGYLGELLASRGYIAVSVDENFLNSDWSKNYQKENDARGWLLLEHLVQWRDWNDDPASPFYGSVDLDSIGLIGHSRGGEAVAVAAAFNRLSHYPDDASETFDYGFAIRGIVAIAPVDGQYEPSGRPTPLADVSYLLLHGSHDADVSSLSGDRLYKRLEVGPGSDTFKASLYIYRANHGQFNTVWGNRDWGLPFGYLLNTRPLLSGDEQRRIGALYMSAFLETVLRDEQRYLPMFQDHRSIRHWLPDTYYVSRFSSGTETIVGDFGEDIDVTTASRTGAVIEGRGLATWREGDLGYRSGSRSRLNPAVFLGWRASDINDSDGDERPAATYTLRLAEPLAAKALLFSVAEADEKPQPPDSSDTDQQDSGEATGDGEQDREEEEDEAQPRAPLDFTIELADASGQVAALPLGSVRALLPPLKARFTRFPPAERRYGKSSEPVLQTVEIPIGAFLRSNPALDAEQLVLIRFRFDRSPEGVIVLDEIGIRSGMRLRRTRGDEQVGTVWR